MDFVLGCHGREKDEDDPADDSEVVEEEVYVRAGDDALYVAVGDERGWLSFAAEDRVDVDNVAAGSATYEIEDDCELVEELEDEGPTPDAKDEDVAGSSCRGVRTCLARPGKGRITREGGSRAASLCKRADMDERERGDGSSRAKRCSEGCRSVASGRKWRMSGLRLPWKRGAGACITAC